MEKHVGHALIATANMIRRCKSPCGKEGLRPTTAMQHFFLGTIYMNSKRGKDTYQKDLEAEFSIRRSTASGILSIMEENDLIRREVSEFDARLKTLVITDAGLEICHRHDREIEEIEERIKQGITPEELDFFFDIISRIRKNIDEKDDWGDKFK